MKKTLIITIILLITINIFLFTENKQIKNQNKTLGEKNENYNTVNKNCYYMFADYFMNAESGIDFELPSAKKCLLDDIFKKGYQIDGINYKILSELEKFQNKFPESNVLDEYKEALKNMFYIESETKNIHSMEVALRIIGDKVFEQKLLNEGKIER